MGCNPNTKYRLRGLEKSALDFLNSKNILINLSRCNNRNVQRRGGHPDFYDQYYKGWEIKCIIDNTDQRGYVSSCVVFTHLQVKKFKDDIRVVMMRHFQKEPEIIIEFGHVKKFITRSGRLSIVYVPLDKVMKL